MNIQTLHQLFLQHPSICTDTRKSKPKSLFFALKGENFDANIFAEEALAKGCSYAIVDNAEVVVNDQYLLVKNVLETLQALANYHRNYCNAKIIGITGTNGKTTTKELTHAVLATTYETIATQGNLNNHIGVPLTLLRLTPTTDIGVIEMGANHPGEIAELCAIAQPDYGIITNVGTGHIEGFGSFEGVVETKTELYKAISQKQGTLFVNLDNGILSEKAKTSECKLYSYGTKYAQIVAKYIVASPFLRLEIEGTEITTKLLGSYNFENVVAAYTIGKFFDLTKSKILTAIANYAPTNNRSQLIKTSNNTLLLDAYNANPTSMKAAILNFDQTDYSNKMLILGDMLELGHLSETAHQEIKTLLKKLNLAEKTWLVGKNFNTKKTAPFTYFSTTAKAKEELQKAAIVDKQILIKGSRGIQLENLIEML